MKKQVPLLADAATNWVCGFPAALRLTTGLPDVNRRGDSSWPVGFLEIISLRDKHHLTHNRFQLPAAPSVSEPTDWATVCSDAAEWTSPLPSLPFHLTHHIPPLQQVWTGGCIAAASIQHCPHHCLLPAFLGTAPLNFYKDFWRYKNDLHFFFLLLHWLHYVVLDGHR